MYATDTPDFRGHGIIVTENFIPTAYQDTLEKLLLGVTFPVFFNPATINPAAYEMGAAFIDKNTADCPRFTHEILMGGSAVSHCWPEFQAFLGQAVSTFGVELEMVRCKVNLNYPIPGRLAGAYCPPHTDSNDPYYVAGIYYVNDSDGDTYFFESPPADGITVSEELKVVGRVTPKKGNFVLFPSGAVHSANPPTHTELRCVVNFGFRLVN